jgi:dihydrodipicolinate synthase/N-acetylneuraminate lyase
MPPFADRPAVSDALERFGEARREVVRRLFPEGIPSLWCPSLTHFTDDGALDRPRMRAHLASMFPHVRGFLLPGSTGEGWELSDGEVRELVIFMAGELHAIGGHLLVGALKPTAAEAIRAMRDAQAALAIPSGTSNALDAFAALASTSVCGFTLCPPAGAARTQEELRAGLDEALSLGVPAALYQLPQVTQNEMSAETLTALAARHPTFYLFKDTSGEDRVAASGFRDVFLVRGAEGGYAGHLAGNGGHYDGFLLSTANCFGRQLAEMIEDVRRGRTERAEAFSRTLTALAAEVFELAGKVGFGNAFTNANKAMDHFFAHGPGAEDVVPPRLRSGKRLPRELIQAAGDALRRHGLMPRRGYLSSAP